MTGFTINWPVLIVFAIIVFAASAGVAYWRRKDPEWRRAGVLAVIATVLYALILNWT
ncbi:DUF4175 domain-containing protein [Pelagibacterium lentulum]|uniref:Uncharacterized protein n=1 Tax=Pelagibacterium lentulum TaxID=2029865 RepID=A0A916W1M3_9HYPH|nr:DUF4175 domain-containing protein [Pelagibacterium lentulum]GGA59956.1 hypothetical protein GCM10011499_32720 [Pelagibacterium lentulum]